MRASPRLLLLSLVAGLALGLPVSAGADVTEAVSTFTYSSNMHPMGYSPRVVPFTGAGSGIFNSDLAFWGKKAYQGTYEGFRIIDISQPDNPVEIENFTGCVQGTTTGNQGDVLVYRNILVRSWNSPAPAGGRGLRRARDARVPGGGPRLRHQRSDQTGRQEVRSDPLRLAYRNRGPRSRQQPAARLQQPVERVARL
jgi:hypothetical protein